MAAAVTWGYIYWKYVMVKCTFQTNDQSVWWSTVVFAKCISKKLWWGLLHGIWNVCFPIINCCWCEWKTWL